LSHRVTLAQQPHHRDRSATAGRTDGMWMVRRIAQRASDDAGKVATSSLPAAV